MNGILFGKLKLFFRTPWTFLLMTGLTIGFVLVMGTGDISKLSVPIYAENEKLQDSVIGKTLMESEAFSFEWVDHEKIYKKVENGRAEFAIILKENEFQIVEGMESFYTLIANQLLIEAYEEKWKQEQLLAQVHSSVQADFKKSLNDKEAFAPFSISYEQFKGENTWIYNDQLHKIFGMTLFFVIYTIAYSVVQILVEKQAGIWDRIILSPVKKSEMYTANLLYSFFLGYVQVVLIFMLFRYGFQVDFHGKLVEILVLLIPYVFTIVALSLLVLSFVKTVQQFNAIMPFIAIGMAMIGGAYWPLEVVESKGMLFLANIMPIKYGMDMLNGITIYGDTFIEIMKPVSILLLMGVLLMGIGMHLMEKRHV
ncbi:ABC transporter permease [Cerasibacillus terrae]|uniref:ABC transporter permease n=1 Tax=Cerasibacillus terrae TaxID=2498845 RepID=A0A5C8NRY5_9BACI|nr:ABC transporter permease [Cerasibacillus terrae]TXL63946.1 ABC transporter permease [Cerasibacillus terrae]